MISDNLLVHAGRAGQKYVVLLNVPPFKRDTHYVIDFSSIFNPSLGNCH